MGKRMRYPRDMRGYGANPPDPEWPGGARVAVQFVVNYEEGGENCILHGDAASEAFLSEIVGAAPWPGKRHWNMESIYEYGARAGFWRLHRMFTAAAVPVTVYGVATALARSPDQVAAMKEAGWEIASHGLRWIDYRDHDEATERADLIEAVRLHTEVVGERPTGMYLGRTSVNSVRLAAAEGGFDWISDTYDDDLPTVEWQLLVETPVAAAGLNSPRIAIRQSPFELDYYAQVGWITRAPEMIQTLIVASFENTDRIIGVGRDVVGLRGNYVLATDLRHFQADQAPGSAADVSIVRRLCWHSSDC